jgi:phenylalanyl-tRNA synthetase beta chain
VTDKASGEFIGVIGEYTQVVGRNFKLPDYVAGFEVDTDALFRAATNSQVSYMPLSRFPSVERDISFRVASSVSYADVMAAATAALEGAGLETSLTPLDIYQPEDGETKTITLRVSLTPFDRTLTSDDASTVMNQISKQVSDTTGATVA